MGCLCVIQLIVQLVFCFNLIAAGSEGITFQSVKQNAIIVGLNPFLNQTTFSLTECYLACLQHLERCWFVEVANVNEGWSCKLFDFRQVRTQDIAKYLKPSQEGSEVSAPKLPRDCVELKRLGFKDSGVYFVREKPAGRAGKKQVFCDMTTDGGGWIVMQRRFDGSVSFYHNWNTYRDGFGDVNGEHWLGNEFVHQYINAYPTELIVEATAFDGEQIAVKMQNFEISDEASKYAMDYSTCEVVKGNKNYCWDWIHTKGYKFSTIDQNNNKITLRPELDCAIKFSGAWWHNDCFNVCLNGNYSVIEPTTFGESILWKSFRGYERSLIEAKMLIRRRV